MKHLTFLLTFGVMASGHALSAGSAPVKNGLILELDAAAQAEARQGALLNMRPVDQWLDSSGGGLVAGQQAAGSRPVFRADGTEAFVRFDGKDDFLPITGPRRLTPAMTVFVLAAPRGNPGNFSALFSTAEAGKNDYTSGLNLDFGPAATSQLSVLNVESAGCTGFRDLLEPAKNLAADLPFEGFHVFTVRSKIGEKGNQLFLDSILLGDRLRMESNIGLDQMNIGSRVCSNDPGEPPFAQGFFQGDVAAVLVYNRALDDAEREKVEQHLFARSAALNALAAGSTGHALEQVKNPPPVQMLVPGFSVEEMPIKLTNLTNLRYRHDGRLVALGYDGRIHLLTDTDGDGMEDKAAIFWDKSVLRGPIGIALLPAGDPRGDGLFVASKGKVSLILDKDRDGVGDEEIVAATGWKENFTNVDATGLAVDPKDGSLYFCLGVENFANAYLVDPATGKSNFDLATDRSSIQRVSADFKTRETICTGVRFACALAFNREGDLFATEQEGATWLPNGNPFDELLHIQRGLHYGFPPRHPKFLPRVIDEPAVMEYGPQHQSAVGMVFNEGVNGGPSFGPDFWKGDALVTGESRGKIYRTKLVKTEEGYVGQNQIIACLTLLTVDNCVTPKGDLLIACHTGPPDWGTGPAGDGRIFKIRRSAPQVPQPVLAWAAASDEFRVAFDKPLKPEEWAGVKDQVKVEAGRYVAAGDRFEVIRPGYQVVRDQMGASRRWVEVQSLALTADHRTLVLRVPAQTEAVSYSITLPTPSSWRTESKIAQSPEMDLGLTLNGIRMTLADSSRAVLPHPSLTVAKAFTEGSADHEAFLSGMAKTAKVTLRGEVDVSNIFQPITQPGSVLDWDVGKDAYAQRTMTLREDFSQEEAKDVALKIPEKASVKTLDLTIASGLRTDGSGLTFSLNGKVRPVSERRLFVPWAKSGPGAVKTDGPPVARTDVKGNWLHGRRIFFGKGACFTCHTTRNEGANFGPDLTNLIHRDRDSVTNDILNPSSTINPEQTGSTVTFTDGAVLNGIVRTLTDSKIVLSLAGGANMDRPRAEVKSIVPMKESLMPEAFGKNLTPAELEDLLTFLLTQPLEPAPITRKDPGLPTARSAAEIAPFLPVIDPAAPPAAAPGPLRILLSAGAKDHGLNEHDYPLWLERWSKLLPLADKVTVSTCMGFPSREQLANADVTVFYSANVGWNPNSAILMDEYQKRGGGLVYLHWAMEGGKEAAALSERIGLATAFSKYRHGPLDLVFTQPDHPITKGFKNLAVLDESYWALRGDVSRVGVLATSFEENKAEPQLWVMQRQNSRVFGCIPGHYTWTFDDPLYRLIVLRGIAWAAQQPDISRLAELMTVGARVAP
ncbi:MAG: ThuA domain-containing protein [Verrucomicrobiota bacterium]